MPACKQALADYVARLPASAHLYPVTGVNFPNSVYVPNGPQNSRSIACNFGVSRQQHPGPSTSVDGIELGLSADGPNDVTITRALEQSAHARKVQSSAGYLFSLESNPPCSAGDCSKAGDCVGATACMGYEVQGEFYVGIAHLSDAAPDRHAAMNGVDYGQVLLDWVNSLSFAGDITAYAR